MAKNSVQPASRTVWRPCPNDRAAYITLLGELARELKAEGNNEVLGMNHRREARDGVDGVWFEVLAFKKNVIRGIGRRR